MKKKEVAAKELAQTLHLLTVKTYVKRNDLKFEPQLTEIDKRDEGEIAAGGGRNEEKEAALRILWPFSWTVTGMSLGWT